ncbi:hypothetical protein EVAR_4917_1 [Eumeta japonica]|uniref:Uncharacterized protein n=1 Tax=Eumeta variegata TaxID=151549 RepID=A0A4C1XXK0_EUMVA|nr:hypothetical protein EVAR_4917_1 [Eumeta japonica]
MVEFYSCYSKPSPRQVAFRWPLSPAAHAITLRVGALTVMLSENYNAYPPGDTAHASPKGLREKSWEGHAGVCSDAVQCYILRLRESAE